MTSQNLCLCPNKSSIGSVITPLPLAPTNVWMGNNTTYCADTPANWVRFHQKLQRIKNGGTAASLAHKIQQENRWLKSLKPGQT